MSPVSVYAELLANIRQVSVRATLPSPSDASTRAALANGGSRLEVRHRGELAILDLPVAVLAPSALPLPGTPATDLVWRLPVPTSAKEAGRFSAEDQAVPWSSRDVRTGSPVCCRQCGGCVVRRDGIGVWKDLPSENWAEMMEFWHCHKPHHHDDGAHDDDGRENGEVLARRGYGADNAITAKPGVGFVDLTSFMVSERDCDNLLFSRDAEATFDSSDVALDGAEPQTVKYLTVSCKTCRAGLGLYNVLAASVTLFKWQVTCETEAPSRPPSSNECLVATLIAAISRSGCSKSVLVPHEAAASAPPGPDRDGRESSPRELLHLWVLNANVIYTSTTVQGRRTAIKVLYRSVAWETGMELVDSMTSTVQEVDFPGPAIDAARESLEESTSMLPAAERSFQQWSVALLERWG